MAHSMSLDAELQQLIEDAQKPLLTDFEVQQKLAKILKMMQNKYPARWQIRCILAKGGEYKFGQVLCKFQQWGQSESTQRAAATVEQWCRNELKMEKPPPVERESENPVDAPPIPIRANVDDVEVDLGDHAPNVQLTLTSALPHVEGHHTLQGLEDVDIDCGNESDVDLGGTGDEASQLEVASGDVDLGRLRDSSTESK